MIQNACLLYTTNVPVAAGRRRRFGGTIGCCGLGLSERLRALLSVGFRGRALPPLRIPGLLGGDGARLLRDSGRDRRGWGCDAASRGTVGTLCGPGEVLSPCLQAEHFEHFSLPQSCANTEDGKIAVVVGKVLRCLGFISLILNFCAPHLTAFLSPSLLGTIMLPQNKTCCNAVQSRSYRALVTLSTCTCFPSHRCRREQREKHSCSVSFFYSYLRTRVGLSFP